MILLSWWSLMINRKIKIKLKNPLNSSSYPHISQHFQPISSIRDTRVSTREYSNTHLFCGVIQSDYFYLLYFKTSYALLLVWLLWFIVEREYEVIKPRWLRSSRFVHWQRNLSKRLRQTFSVQSLVAQRFCRNLRRFVFTSSRFTASYRWGVLSVLCYYLLLLVVLLFVVFFF